MDEGGHESRSRLIVAAVLVVGLVAAVLVVVLAGAGDDSQAEAADSQCVQEWNDDEEAIAFGLHQFSGHGYERVEVLRLTEEGKPTESESGLCAVVFAARSLDPEPGSRAQVLDDGRWTGIETLGNVDEREIARLQTDAFARVNASLEVEGRLTANDTEG